MPKFHHGQLVDGNTGREIVRGVIRCVTSAHPPGRVEPEYGIIPQGEISLTKMVRVSEPYVSAA
jgi:hypothetical protein